MRPNTPQAASVRCLCTSSRRARQAGHRGRETRHVMMPLRCRTLNTCALAVYGFFVYLLISQGPLPVLVMCFGGTGHIAVETAHAPSQAPAASQHDGPCRDLPLLIASPDGYPLVPPPRPAPHKRTPTLTTCAMPLSLAADLLPGCLWTPPMPSPKPSLTSLRTIVLLM